MEFDASSLVVDSDRSVLGGRSAYIVIAISVRLVNVVSDGSVVSVIFCDLFIVAPCDVFLVPFIVV